VGHEYIEPLEPRRVLMWAGEDDEGELWRRQLQVCSWMGQPLSALTERFYLQPYADADITLASLVYGALAPTPMLSELREQVRDYRAEVVILDNNARVYGGSENDRHQVTTFLAWLAGACAPASILLLGHPAKAAGSEYSGSTAWEGAVRSRLYLSDRTPDADDDDSAPIDDRIRYLARRKSNYSALDLRRLTLADGVLIPDTCSPGSSGKPTGAVAQDIVMRAVRKLADIGQHGSASTNSPTYLPRLAKQYRFLDGLTEKQFAAHMRELLVEKRLEAKPVGTYANRTPKLGLVEVHK
jgi:hypothetical protein